MRYVAKKSGFFYEPKDTDYVFGSGQLKGEVIRPDSSWADYLPVAEDQKEGDIETSACVTFHWINAIEIVMEEMGLGKDFDYSERFISLLSETTPTGNSPTKVAETIRKYGLIPQSMMPFDETIQSWDDFNSWKGANKELCLQAGRQWLKKYNFNYDTLWRGDITPADKHNKITEALKYSPVCASVFAWADIDGEYIKPEGTQDNHFTTIIKPNLAFDTYEPYLKNLVNPYDHLVAFRVVVTKKPAEEKVTFLQALFNIIKTLWQKIIQSIS